MQDQGQTTLAEVTKAARVRARLSQDQLALSLLRVEKAILRSVQTPEEAFEIVRDVAAWPALNGGPSSYSPSAKRPSAKSKSGKG